METTYIKQKAIAKQLGDLFEGTCSYHISEETRHPNDPMEPDEDALDEFRAHLVYLAELHHKDHLGINNVYLVQKFVNNVGRKVGHIWGDDYGSSIGVWGVRRSEMENLMSILVLPDKDLINIGSMFTLNSTTFIMTSARVALSPHWLQVGVKVPGQPEHHEFEITVRWSDLHVLYKPEEE